MAEIVVPDDARPSLPKYVAFVLVPVLLVDALFAMLVDASTGPVVLLAGATLVAAFNVAVLLVVVQSIVEKWFDAATVRGS